MPQIIVGNGGVNRKVNQLTVGVGGVNRKVKEAWAGIGGVNRKVFSSNVQIGALPIGTIVKLAVSGSPRNFLVVQQGKPSDRHDDSCIGTWLLMQDIFESHTLAEGSYSNYGGGTLDRYLNQEFIGRFDANVRGIIQTTKVYYNASDYGTTSAQLFVLSAGNVGLTSANDSNMYDNVGDKLAYFYAGTGADANARRVAKSNGAAGGWWTSTQRRNTSGSYLTFFTIMPDGSYNKSYGYNSSGVRPALIIPQTQMMTEESEGYVPAWN